jgi:ApbE superfamily uncharacterized protein (UPF0280 family)
VKDEIIKQRKILEEYILRQPQFQNSLEPMELLPDAPLIAGRMHEASMKTGVGPMAAVAGIMAEFGAKAALDAGAEEAIVENGGDIYIYSKEDVYIGLYAGSNSICGKLAFQIKADTLPLAVCSSSSKMGHSLSFGSCDLATVISKDAALADAAATLACNLVKEPSDINGVVEKIAEIPGIIGITIVKGEKVGLAGEIPTIVKNTDQLAQNKITMDVHSNYTGKILS